jgi:flagellar basal body-associated protein FliL
MNINLKNKNKMKNLIIIIAMIAMAITTNAQTMVVMYPAPTAYDLTLNIGSDIEKPNIKLSGSQENVSYQLYSIVDKKGKKVPVGKPIKGTGDELMFSPNTKGTFGVIGTSSEGCSNDMKNSVSITYAGLGSSGLGSWEYKFHYRSPYTAPIVKDENVSILKTSDWIIIVLFLAIILIVLYGIKNRLSKKHGYTTGDYKEIKPVAYHLKFFKW